MSCNLGTEHSRKRVPIIFIEPYAMCSAQVIWLAAKRLHSSPTAYTAKRISMGGRVKRCQDPGEQVRVDGLPCEPLSAAVTARPRLARFIRL